MNPTTSTENKPHLTMITSEVFHQLHQMPNFTNSFTPYGAGTKPVVIHNKCPVCGKDLQEPKR